MGEQPIKCKLIVVLLSLFLISCCLPSFGYTASANKIKLLDNKTSEYLFNVNDFFPFVIRSSPVDNEVNNDNMASKPIAKITPGYFNWMDYKGEDYTTPARAQGWCGSCWAFAALGIIESVIEIKEGSSNLNPDLSEQYILSYLPKAGSCMGGTCTKALELILNTSADGNYQNGVIQESYLKYQQNDSIDVIENPDWENQLVPIMNFGTWYTDPEDIEEIKTQIMTSGPVAAAMFVIPEFTKWLMTHHKSDEYFPYPGDVSGTNHEVIIVGWKNNPSIDNGGYWICKNSWGKGFGYNGFFNIEYGSLNIDNSKIVYVEYDPNSYDWSPVTHANGIYYASIGDEITFDASGSFDADGEIVKYNWDFGDGAISSSSTATHVYKERGIFTVTLTTIDNYGNIGVDKTWAFIDASNEKPNAPIISGLNSGLDRTWYDYTFSATDPEGDDIYYYIDWDDGFIDEWIGPYSSGEEITLSHFWYFKDIYNIKVKVKDIYGDIGEWESFKVGIPDYKPHHESPLLKYLLNFFSQNSLLVQLLEKMFQF